MKFCLVTETFHPEINGVAMTLKRLVDGLQKNDIEVTVVRPMQKTESTTLKNSYKEILMPGFPFPNYPELRFGAPAGNKLKKLWLNDRPDFVHVATEGPLGLSAIKTANKLGILTVSSFHTNFHSYGKYYSCGFFMNFFFRYLRYFHNLGLATFVPEERLCDDLNKKGFNKVKILGRGVDIQLYNPHRRNKALRMSWGASDETPVLIYVGRVASEKNLDFLFKVYESIKTKNQLLKFVVVGDGPIRKKLELRYPEVFFTGLKMNEELAEHYASGDIFIFPSETETFGNVVTEAMASGLPVLAYNYAAPGKYIIDNENGYLVEYGNESLFFERAMQIFDESENWKAIGKSARITMETISWEPIILGYMSDLKRLNNEFKCESSIRRIEQPV